jgi:hypothetical protein
MMKERINEASGSELISELIKEKPSDLPLAPLN